VVAAQFNATMKALDILVSLTGDLVVGETLLTK